MSIDRPSTPSMAESVRFLADELKVQPETIAVKKITNNYGTRTFVINAFVYDDVETKNIIEPKHKDKKKELAK